MPNPKYLTFRVVNLPNGYTEIDLHNDFHSIRKLSLAASHLCNDTQVATMTFDATQVPKCLQEKNLGFKQSTRVQLQQADVVVDRHFKNFTVLHCPREKAPKLDVIAVTGLAGHAYGSWKDSGEEFMWLRDSLPEDIPTARIIIYGHDSAIRDSNSKSSINDIAHSLLSCVRIARQDLPVRPIVFIGHSLGGIVIKQAIVLANANPQHPHFLASISGMLLFGVPNEGMATEELAAASRGQQREGVAHDLSIGSTYLKGLAIQFSQISGLRNTKIFTFYETEHKRTVEKIDPGSFMGGSLLPIIVNKKSSIPSPLPNGAELEPAIPIDQNHSDMVKFTCRSDENYAIVKLSIQNILQLSSGQYIVPTSPQTTNPSPYPMSAHSWGKFRYALKEHNLDQIENMITMREIGWNAKNNKGNTAFAELIDNFKGSESVNLVHRLLQKTDLNVNASNQRGETALHLAIRKADILVVKALLECEAVNTNAANRENWTPLHYVARAGNLGLLGLFLTNPRVDIHAKTQLEWTALHLASRNGLQHVVRQLLETRIDVNAKDKNGWTALHHAARNNWRWVAQALLKHNQCHANIRTNKGDTPLNLTYKYGAIGVRNLIKGHFRYNY